MDSRIIDVAIGLVLVFALTSLLVATLVEAFSTMRKQRGRVLRQAIASFVGDNSTFAEQLLNHPLIVSLAPSPETDANRKPSYISADVMVTSLLSQLTASYSGGIRPSSPAELVSAITTGGVAAAGIPAPTSFATGLASLLPGVENDWPAYEKRLQAWFDSVTERSTGWYKRWTQSWLFIIGLLVAAAVNIDPLAIAPHLWNDAASREAIARLGVSVSEQYEASKATGTEQATATGRNQSSLPPLTSLPQRTDATEAVARDYARLTQSMFVAIEATEGRPDAIEPRARLRILQYLDELPGHLDRIRMRDDASSAYLSNRENSSARIDQTLDQLRTLIPRREAYAETHRQRDALASSIAVERVALAARNGERDLQCAESEDPAVKSLCVRLRDLDKLKETGLPIGWSDAVLSNLRDPKPCKPSTDHKKQTTDCGQSRTGQLALMLLGWIITAIAVTLGAPFWFDILSKVVKLRGSGPRIDGDTEQAKAKPSVNDPSTATATSIAATSRVPMSDALNPAEAGLQEHEVRRIQRALSMPDIAVSGYFDAATRAAINQWQSDHGQDATGEFTQAQIQELLGLASGAGDDYVG
ncbi:peptidoglycan-binding domain-containing protein [Peristeroidobacter soli]|uniref:peptidoglycan-binding domain-containing protein n=1 Tax=Peristeroidobacter soli TaxID=2497877 RepID=UPI00101B6830|nr:peptidoglycan-binding domain-containing protein [Peristeroidobacter soli]